MIPFCNNRLFLFLFGWMLPPKPAFMKFTTTPVVRAMTFTKQVFQDIVLPINRYWDNVDTNSICYYFNELQQNQAQNTLKLFVLYFHRLEDQIDVSEKLFDTYPILIYPCKIYDTGLGQLRAPKKGIFS